MKTWKLPIIVAIIGTVILSSLFLHARWKEQQELAAFDSADKTIKEYGEQLKADTQAAEMEYVRVKFGEYDAKLYKTCVEFPPTQEQNKQKCAALMRKIHDAEQKEPKW